MTHDTGTPGTATSGTATSGTATSGTAGPGSPPPGGAPPPAVWPAVRARDARALIAFLVRAFGFTEVVSYGDGDRVDHAQLSWPPGGGIMLGSDRGDDEQSVPCRPGTLGVYVVTSDPDGLFARATAAGAEVITGLHDTDYGSRDFSVRDPEGNRWSFGTYPGEPVPR